jgi:hypothetical protein
VLEAVVSADSEMTGHEMVGARYQDVVDSLRTAYDGRAEWRDQQEKPPNDLHEPARFFPWRTGQQIRHFVTQYFTLSDFHIIAPGRMHFQSLTLRRPA